MEEYKKITLESYKQNARFFDEHFKGAFNLVKREEFFKFLNLLSGKRILDVGCGGGEHALWFRNQGMNVTAIDFSPHMVEIANEKGVSAQVIDMENMPFKENSFDGIWAVTSLLHLKKENVPNVLASFSSILDKKGILFLVVKKGLSEELRVDTNNSNTKRYFSYWQKDELNKILEKQFTLLEFWEDTPRDATFLHFLLMKII